MNAYKIFQKINPTILSLVVVNIFLIASALRGNISIEEVMVIYFLDIILSVLFQSFPLIIYYFRTRKIRGRLYRFFACTILLFVSLSFLILLGSLALQVIFPGANLDSQIVLGWTLVLFINHVIFSIFRWSKSKIKIEDRLESFISIDLYSTLHHIVLIVIFVGIMWALESLDSEILGSSYHSILIIVYAFFKMVSDIDIYRQYMGQRSCYKLTWF